MDSPCERCGSSFRVSLNQTRFCSRTCWLAHKRDSIPKLVCATCGKEFRRSASLGGKYCSSTCSGRARRWADDDFYSVRSEWYQSRGWPDFVKALIEKIEACVRCGSTERLTGHHLRDPFPSRDAGALLDESNVEILCSGCHTREHHDQGLTTTCETCHVVFHVRPSRLRRFCSLTCRDKHPDFAKMKPRTCPECGATFQPKHPSSMRCSSVCAAKATARVKLERRPEFHCATCGLAFRVSPSRAKAIGNKPACCSVACSLKLRAHR